MIEFFSKNWKPYNSWARALCFFLHNFWSLSFLLNLYFFSIPFFFGFCILLFYFCFCFCFTLKLYTVIFIVFHEQIKSILTIFRCMFVFIILDGFFSLSLLFSLFIGIQLHSSHIFCWNGFKCFLLISFMSFLSKFFSQILLFCFALFSVWFNINTCVQRMWFGFIFTLLCYLVLYELDCRWFFCFFLSVFFHCYFAILYAIYFLLFCFFYSASRTSFYNKKNESTCKTKCKDLVFFSPPHFVLFLRNGFLL